MDSRDDRPPKTEKSSRLSAFYLMSLGERTQTVAKWADLDDRESASLRECLTLAQADVMIENVIGRYALPMGIGTNFRVNDQDYLIPMIVEEPSVVAAVSNAAKLARTGGGFHAGATRPVMIGQVQLLDLPDVSDAANQVIAAKEELLTLADTSPSITARGGGPVDIDVRRLEETTAGPMLIVHLLFDARDAMGANAVNTAVEAMAPRLEQLTGGRALLRILSNLTDQRRAWSSVEIPVSTFDSEARVGLDIANGIAEATAFAVADPYRAATHNKGIMNGIDAVALATGNDWRAIEAGAHAYAARNGQYRSLTAWRVESGLSGLTLCGRIELPLAVGIVGGATKSHPTARTALKILGVESAGELAYVMAAVGLAQNLAALRALVSEGIQHGHMSLHARQVASAAGAAPDQVATIATQLVREGQIREARARELLAQLEKSDDDSLD